MLDSHGHSFCAGIALRGKGKAVAPLQHDVVNLLDGVNLKDIAADFGKRPNTDKCSLPVASIFYDTISRRCD